MGRTFSDTDGLVVARRNVTRRNSTSTEGRTLDVKGENDTRVGLGLYGRLERRTGGHS